MAARFQQLLGTVGLLLCVGYFFYAGHAVAQFDFGTSAPKADVEASALWPPIRWGETRTQHYRAGIKLEPGMSLGGTRILIPIPQNWGEEQKVRLLNEKNETNLRATTRSLGGVTILELSAPTLRPPAATEVVFTYEVTRREILAPTSEEIATLAIPKKLPPPLEPYVKDESPKIEHKNRKFTQLFQEITAGVESDWGKVEAIYDFVRERLTYDDSYKNKTAKGALTTITDGKWCGDCKDMTFVFVAICRAGKIPARTVRLPTHCYAEFYLEGTRPSATAATMTTSSAASGSRARRPQAQAAPVGRWYPCELAGDRHFGEIIGMSGGAPILQRGDNYTLVDLSGKAESVYYFKETFEAAEIFSGTNPKFSFIHTVLAQ